MDSLSKEIAQHLPASDFFVSLPFWGYFAVAVLCYRLVPTRSELKGWLLLLSSVCMLLTLPRFDFVMLGLLVITCGVTFGCAKLLLDEESLPKQGARRTTATIGIVLNILLLAFFKYRFFQDTILGRRSVTGSSFIFLIGISYTSFRAMHFVIEAYKKEIRQPGLLGFLNYMLFFPAFISGPIHRYNHFWEHSSAAENSTFRADARAGFERIIHGLFKKTVLTVILYPYTLTSASVPIQEMPLWKIATGLYALALYYYFDFSGYTDLAIGSARFMGFGLPENFNYPFLKKNIQQLWANWHMSLTSWLTDYVYWPLVRKLRTLQAMKQHPVLLSNAAIIVTFAICGAWHGDSINFLLWGVYQGFGIAAVNTYQSWKRKVRNPRARKYFASRFSHGLGVFLTFNFFAIGQSLFVLNLKEVASSLPWLAWMVS